MAYFGLDNPDEITEKWLKNSAGPSPKLTVIDDAACRCIGDAERAIAQLPKKSVVFIDYLQMLGYELGMGSVSAGRQDSWRRLCESAAENAVAIVACQMSARPSSTPRPAFRGDPDPHVMLDMFLASDGSPATAAIVIAGDGEPVEVDIRAVR